MDKNGMNDDKKRTAELYPLNTAGMQEIHKQCGLYIIHGNIGIQTVPDSFFSAPPRYFQFYSISHMYAGAGKLWFASNPDKIMDIHAGQYVCISPDVIHRYGGAHGKSYYEDALSFFGPVADMLFRSGVFADGIFSLGNVRRIAPILETVSDPSIESQLTANMELQKLLLELYLAKRSAKQLNYPLIEQLIEEIRQHPERWWSVQTMAEMSNLSIDQFRRVFYQYTGVKPKTYVDNLKLKLAAQYLSSSTRSIEDIARSFGYHDQYHFSRRFKSVIGNSPASYRKKQNGQK